MSLGPAKVGEIKKIVREYVKLKKDVIGTLDVKVPPSMLMSLGGVASERTDQIPHKRHKMTPEVRIYMYTYNYYYIVH